MIGLHRTEVLQNVQNCDPTDLGNRIKVASQK